ncbi:MAG TPA: oxaloacetate decarboxylase, partial [Gammaproteobacteria bacterium]|nr:oxaloacetate decarboxylase [Gammaproteobacteria bacterium]
VEGKQYVVEVDAGGEITHYEQAQVNNGAQTHQQTKAEPITSPLAGNIWKVLVTPGAEVQAGDVLLILEAMKMETQIVADRAGHISTVMVKPGDAVQVGEPLVSIQ